MVKETDMGQGFVMNKEKGIMKDGKVVFTPNQLTDAYNRGYDQGRFDEYADRMGKEQAEKIRARLEKQESCPYCHVGSEIRSLYNRSPWNDTELYFDRVDSDIVLIGNNTWGDIDFDPVNRTLTSWDDGSDPLIVSVEYCPICGRPLNKE